MPNRAKSCLVATVAVALTALGGAACGTPSKGLTPLAGAGTGKMALG